jgi:hydroxyacylglutathione hydrolase
LILKRFYDDNLAQASFLVGCARTGTAIVIDPNRDIGQYLAAAETEGVQIEAVTETHIHADYLSGTRELAAATGARMYLSDEGDAEWKYEFASDPNVTLVRDGDSIRVGNVRLDVKRTPGHTPEHVSFIVTDEPASSQPLGAFTGDFIFVGDVGRPDLLERAAGVSGAMEAGARTLFKSLTAFKASMPDTLILWPGHGSGSACGKALGGVPVSVLGYEKVANWGLKFASEDQFAAAVLEGQPDPPVYFKRMKLLNRAGPPILGEVGPLERLDPGTLVGLLASKAAIVDVRPQESVARGYARGSIAIPLERSFTTWSGWLLPYEEDLFIIAEDAAQAELAARHWRMIGLDRARGWFGAEALAALGHLASIPQMNAKEVREAITSGDADLLDVRSAAEHAESRIPGAVNIPLGHLPRRVDEVSIERPLVVHCASGHRSAIAATVLSRAGVRDVINASGGIEEYLQAEYPVEEGRAEAVGV